MKATVIISTYNSPEWLQKVLWGYENQSVNDFDIIIADDGSNSETADMIKAMKKNSKLDIKHVWHEDQGFQKTKILNKAILATTTDYLIFTDGDCIPRQDFIEIHLKWREKGCFLSGGYFKLPLSLSEMISEDFIKNQYCFDLKWLKKNGLSLSHKNLKLSNNEDLKKVLNQITPTNATWNGHNSSGWKSDILAVNGFDERMQYGGEDREFGERLINFGIKTKHVRYFAIVIHLDHPRGYKTPESLKKNLQIRKNVRQKGLKWTPFGIKK